MPLSTTTRPARDEETKEELRETTQQTPTKPRHFYLKRFTAITVVLVGLTLYTFFVGVPGDLTACFAWAWAAIIAWRINEPVRSHLRWLIDWMPVYGLILLYDVVRSYGDDIFAVNVYDPLRVDQLLMGGPSNMVDGGHIPTTWLQEKLFDPNHIPLWELPVSFVYVSHFFIQWIIAVILYLNARHHWRRYMNRFLLLSASGILTYLLYPAAPPWMAHELGAIEQYVWRFPVRGWALLGLDWGDTALNTGKHFTNAVAAMPSLHAAGALFVTVFLLPFVKKYWWPLILLYPLTMAFAIVYMGEHYVADVIAGWAYVGIAFIVLHYVEKWWYQRRRGAREQEPDQKHGSDRRTAVHS